MIRTLFLAAALTSTLFVAGCGSSEYCDALKASQSRLEELSSADDADTISQVTKTFGELRDAAPSDLADDWKLMYGALSAIDEATAGVSEAQLEAIRSGKPAEGVTDKQRSAITEAFLGLVDPDVATAAQHIQDQGSSECKVDLSS